MDFTEINSADTYKIYEQYGLVFKAEQNRLYYNDKLVRNFEDMQKNNDNTYSGTTSYYDDGDIDVYAVRDDLGQLKGLSTDDNIKNSETKFQIKIKK